MLAGDRKSLTKGRSYLPLSARLGQTSRIMIIHHRFADPGAGWKRSLDTGIGGVYHGHHHSAMDRLSSRRCYIVETGSSSFGAFR